MRAILINTGTELLLGDVQDAHLAFIAREILPLGLRIDERRTVPDSDVIRRTLIELFPHCEILFVTGGLGPTTDDITREMVAESLGLGAVSGPATVGLASTKTANARNQMDYRHRAAGGCPSRRAHPSERERKRLGFLFEDEHQSAHSVAARVRFARSASRASAHVQKIRDAVVEIDCGGAASSRAAIVQHCRRWANRWLRKRLAKKF